ncbi:MAG: Glyoxalase-like domain protein [Chlorobi bacterium OLB5]|nr:MAG: Glyoxalase-like domain protein [Chlorobi bacterium OLB5]
MRNTINWFELPVVDFDRAKKFYEAIFEAKIEDQMMGPFRMGFLPSDGKGVSGAIVHGEGYEPSDKGAMVYLNADGILDEMLGRISKAGGNVVVPRTPITPEIGDFAIFMDTEGNKVALHTPPPRK